MSGENVCKHFQVGYCKYGLKKNVKKEHAIKSATKDISNLAGMDLGAKGKMNVSSNTTKKIIGTKLFFMENLK